MLSIESGVEVEDRVIGVVECMGCKHVPLTVTLLGFTAIVVRVVKYNKLFCPRRPIEYIRKCIANCKETVLSSNVVVSLVDSVSEIDPVENSAEDVPSAVV